MTVPTPTLDKMLANKDISQTIGEFLDWLREQGFVICEMDDEEYWPIQLGIEQLLAQYLDIDLDKAEQERMALLEEIRNAYD